MAVVSVSANNTRVEDAEAITGWSSIGGGAGASAEGSFPYQSSNLVNRKITSSTGAGFYYDPISDAGSTHDMTTAAKTAWLVKCIVTDYGGLQATNGVRLRIGSGTTAYYDYVVAGSNAKIAVLDKYPAKGGFVIIPIDPNIAGYRDSTTGSPVLTAVDYFGIVAAFSASTAKSENVGLDAIDLGTGLTLVGGDGASTDGTFDDFLSFDEGTTSNRYGYVTQADTILKCFGMLTIGTATATGFTDNTSKLIFLDGLFDAGYAGITADLQNASTVISIGCTIESLGTDTVVNTRADFVTTGTSGSLTFTGQLINFRNITFTSVCDVDGALLECSLLTQASANIENCTIRTNSASTVACLQDPTFGVTTDLNNTHFIQNGSGHAIEIDTTGTYTLTNLTYSGYGGTEGSNLTANSGANDAVILNSSGGLVTLNISGTQQPSIRNTAGSTTQVNVSYILTLTDVPSGVQVTIVNSSTRTELQNSTSTGANITYTHSGGETVDILFMGNDYDPLGSDVYDLTLPSADSSIKVALSDDLNYENP